MPSPTFDFGILTVCTIWCKGLSLLAAVYLTHMRTCAVAVSDADADADTDATNIYIYMYMYAYVYIFCYQFSEVEEKPQAIFAVYASVNCN